VPGAAARLAEVGAGHALEAVGARIGEHRLEPRSGGRVRVLPPDRGPLRRADARVELVAGPLESGQVEETRNPVAAGRRERLARLRQPPLQGRELPAQGAAGRALVGLDGQPHGRGSAGEGRRHRQPPMGARGLAPQKTCVPSIPMRWMRTMFTTIDFAVAVPTPTGPPPAW
jgi:hypothetical protein